MLITKQTRNKISGDFSRELDKIETREVREAHVASQTSQISYYISFNNCQDSSQYFANFKQNWY